MERKFEPLFLNLRTRKNYSHNKRRLTHLSKKIQEYVGSQALRGSEANLF